MHGFKRDIPSSAPADGGGTLPKSCSQSSIAAACDTAPRRFRISTVDRAPFLPCFRDGVPAGSLPLNSLATSSASGPHPRSLQIPRCLGLPQSASYLGTPQGLCERRNVFRLVSHNRSPLRILTLTPVQIRPPAPILFRFPLHCGRFRAPA
jgi:hypothetical protein